MRARPNPTVSLAPRPPGPPASSRARANRWIVHPGRLGAVALLAGLVACSGKPATTDPPGGLPPTEPRLLSLDSPDGDEDPSVLRAPGDSLLVAWFSSRGGNPDIYLAAAPEGGDFGAPIRVTTSEYGDFDPTLFRDDAGTFHLVWFRWVSLQLGLIWHNTSRDGLTWDTATEEPVTYVLGSDDWVPTVTQRADGTLLVYFVSDKLDPVNPTYEIYVATKAPGATRWSDAVPVPGMNSPTEHDHLPNVARTGDGLTLVWTRNDRRHADPWLNPKADVYLATSTDGLTWSAPQAITRDIGDVVNVFPVLYREDGGAWALSFLSSRSGAPRPYTLRLDQVSGYPATARDLSALPAGYSHHIVATSTPGIYFAAWVQGPRDHQDIYYRYFRR